jgi:dihydrolipoamide dehydrogenase
MDQHYDALVIGGDPGNTPAAIAMAQAGKKVLLEEAGLGLGGSCLFGGCIPSKAFRETANFSMTHKASFQIQPVINK